MADVNQSVVVVFLSKLNTYICELLFKNVFVLIIIITIFDIGDRFPDDDLSFSL